MFFEKMNPVTILLILLILAGAIFALVGCDAAQRNQDNNLWSQITPEIKKTVEEGDRK